MNERPAVVLVGVETYGQFHCSNCDRYVWWSEIMPVSFVPGTMVLYHRSQDDISLPCGPIYLAHVPGRCCDNGFFGDGHSCQKQDGASGLVGPFSGGGQ